MIRKTQAWLKEMVVGRDSSYQIYHVPKCQLPFLLSALRDEKAEEMLAIFIMNLSIMLNSLV